MNKFYPYYSILVQEKSKTYTMGYTDVFINFVFTKRAIRDAKLFLNRCELSDDWTFKPFTPRIGPDNKLLNYIVA
jgi:hypothetical protein